MIAILSCRKELLASDTILGGAYREREGGTDRGRKTERARRGEGQWGREQEKDETRPMYRSKAWYRIERRKEKEREEVHWLRKDEKAKHDFPIFCPCM